MGPHGHRHATAACDRQGRRRRFGALLALLLTLLLTGGAFSRGTAPVDVTISVAAMPDGAVQLDPPGEASGDQAFALCRYDYPDGECDVTYAVEEGKPLSLKLTAVPGASQTFLRWSALECGSGPVCTIDLTAGVQPPEVWAVFSPATFTVLIAGAGTVTGANGTIDCTLEQDGFDPGPDCTESSFAAGTPLTLTAEGAGGAEATWVLGCDPGDEPGSTCAFVPENRYIGVRFGSASGPAPPFDVKVSLRVVKSGDGSGTVSGGPIECGATCVATPALRFGERVKLTADAAAGSRFIRWVGVPCTTQSTCVLNAGPVTAVGAVFAANPPAPQPQPQPQPQPPPQPPPTAPPTTTTAPPTTTEAPRPPRLLARLLGTSSRRVGGRYRVHAQVELSKLATARLRVLRGGRLLGQRTVAAAPGRRTLWVALARTTRAGPGLLQLRLTDRDGQVVTLSRRVVVGL